MTASDTIPPAEHRLTGSVGIETLESGVSYVVRLDYAPSATTTDCSVAHDLVKRLEASLGMRVEIELDHFKLFGVTTDDAQVVAGIVSRELRAAQTPPLAEG
jgi:hypothetical protein